MSPNTSSQPNTTSNHSFLIDARLVLAVSGSAQSVFVGSNQIEASEEKLYMATQVESKARGTLSKGRGTRH